MSRGTRLVRHRDVADCTAGVAGRLTAAPALSLLAGALTAPGNSVVCVDRDAGGPPLVALTWDDGPSPEHTPKVLDELAAAGARATFFVLVLAAEAHPALVRRMLDEGHEVALHGIDHRRLASLPDVRALRLVAEGRRRLEHLTGAPVRLFRPPYGITTPGQVLGARALGLRTVLWSVWAGDWAEVGEAELAERVLRAAHPGAVVLLHDAYGEALTDPSTPGPGFARHLVARGVLAGLAERGLASVPVGELLAAHRAVTTVAGERALMLRC